MSVVSTPPDQVQAPAYVITEIDVTDAEAFREYAPQVQPTFQPFGGRYVVRGGNARSLAGAVPNRIVVIAFDSMERARSWYDSPNYEALKSLRDKAGQARIFAVESAIAYDVGDGSIIFDRPHRGSKPRDVGYAPFATERVRHCTMP